MAKKNPDNLNKKKTLLERIFPDKRGEPEPEGTGVVAMIRGVVRRAVNLLWEIFDWFDMRFGRRVREKRVIMCWLEHGRDSEKCKELEDELFPNGDGPSTYPKPQ